MQTAKNITIIETLIPTLTSAFSEELQRKPLIKYTTGLRSVTVCQIGGSLLIE